VSDGERVWFAVLRVSGTSLEYRGGPARTTRWVTCAGRRTWPEVSRVGYLNTDWGDNGHWRALPVNYLDLCTARAWARCYEAMSFDAAVLNRFAFDDLANEMGRRL
jgi:hypothetical protein